MGDDHQDSTPPADPSGRDRYASLRNGDAKIISYARSGSPYNIHHLDPDGNVLHSSVDDPLIDMTTIIGKNLQDLIHPDDCKAFRLALEKAFSGQAHTFAEYRIQNPDATRFICLIIPATYNLAVVYEMLNEGTKRRSHMKLILLRSAGILQDKEAG